VRSAAHVSLRSGEPSHATAACRRERYRSRGSRYSIRRAQHLGSDGRDDLHTLSALHRGSAGVSDRSTSIEKLLQVMQRLRDPERGCPWDREQTFATIAPYTIEEAYEVAD